MKAITALALLFILTACNSSGGSSGGSSTTTHNAPASLNGVTFDVTITSGQGEGVATKGTASITFSEKKYNLTSDDSNIDDDSGTYTYTHSGAKGTVILTNANDFATTYILTYTASTSGTFTATAEGDREQNGTFSQRKK